MDAVEELFPSAESCRQTPAIIASCKSFDIWKQAPQELRARMLYFRICLEADATAYKHAFAMGAFIVSEADMDRKAEFIAQVLAASSEGADSICRRMPSILTLKIANISSTVNALQSLGFSLTQMRELCIKEPALLSYNFTSELRTEKWKFLTHVLQLTHDDFVAKPKMLMASLSARIAPRWEYLQRLKSMQSVDFSHAREVANCLSNCSDDHFERRFSPKASSLLGPYSDFKSSWLQSRQSHRAGTLPAIAKI